MSRFDNVLTQLEDDVRRKRPSSQPLSPVFKQRLRAQLLEEADMMHKVQLGSGIARLASALAATAVLVLIPLYFWLSLSQKPPDFEPLSAAAVVDGERPSGQQATESSAQITDIGLAEVINDLSVEVPLTIAYTLVNETEATIYLSYTAPSEGGTFYGERLLAATEANGMVETTIDLPAYAAKADGTLQDDVVFEIEIIPAGSIPDESVGDSDNFATIASAGTAVAHEGDDTLMDVPIQIQYKLTDYDSAGVVVGYNEVPLDVLGQAELIEVTVDYEGNVLDEEPLIEVTQGEGTLDLVVVVPAELVNADGTLSDDAGLWVSLKIVELMP